MRFTMREESVMSWKPRKCDIALLTLAALTCFAALIAVNIKPQHDAYPSSLSIKMGQDFSLGRNVNYFNKLKPNEQKHLDVLGIVVSALRISHRRYATT